MPYCNESVTEHVKMHQFLPGSPFFEIVIELPFQWCNNYCCMFRNEHTGTDYVQVFSLIRFDSCRPFYCVMEEKGWRGKKERSVSENYEMCQRKRELH